MDNEGNLVKRNILNEDQFREDCSPYSQNHPTIEIPCVVQNQV